MRERDYTAGRRLTRSCEVRLSPIELELRHLNNLLSMRAIANHLLNKGNIKAARVVLVLDGRIRELQRAATMSKGISCKGP